MSSRWKSQQNPVLQMHSAGLQTGEQFTFKRVGLETGVRILQKFHKLSVMRNSLNASREIAI
jgi:hypothetical protein